MTTFTIDVTDPYLLAGLAAARDSFNNSLILAKDQLLQDHPDYIASDDDYFVGRMNEVLKSYANNFGYDPVALAKLQAQVSELQTKLTAAVNTFPPPAPMPPIRVSVV